MKTDVIVIGGGAAGLFCAAEAGKRGRSVVVLERAEKVGKKILISGGGRCNFTNREVSAANYVSNNPHFAKSALARYTPQDFVKLVEKHGIEYYEKKLGQLFCRDTSRRIVEMLLDECAAGNVQIKTNCEIKSLQKTDDIFEVETNIGSFESESLVVACGGLSFPKVGATDFGYKIARQFDLKIEKTRPALVPLVFGENRLIEFGKLAGVSLETTASFGDAAFKENILFTHRGLSGPAILQISNYWKPKEQISFDLLTGKNAYDLLADSKNSRQELVNFLSQHLPSRFAEKFCAEFTSSKPLNQYSPKEIERIAELLHNWRLRFDETEGYHKAEVTLGGVSTDELSSKTMEAKRVKNLYFIGEVVDVTGWLGGYNFQWAWASGFAAGQFV
ncbi:MAG: NAD(P)/FAD-dependent oxidoreductase [Acidobacteriota bacterium]|nr:NAD(P)/FAD-dependent oxidoreductase [Acidobacteriota bacterium]